MVERINQSINQSTATYSKLDTHSDTPNISHACHHTCQQESSRPKQGQFGTSRFLQYVRSVFRAVIARVPVTRTMAMNVVVVLEKSTVPFLRT
jgi:hypothetical protein